MPSKKPIKLPRRTRGRAWKVRVAPRIRHWGHCNYTDREIVLSAACEKHGVARQVLLHELIHKIMPWLDEDAVDDAATELDDALEAMEM